LITGGASAGLNIALQKVTWPGYTRRVFMVAPTYYLAAGSFIGISCTSAVMTLDCGYSKRFTGIPEDEEGLDIAILKSEIEKYEEEEETERPSWQKWTYRYVFYGVPTFSNPTGSVMSLARREELVDVSLSPPCLTVACAEVQYAPHN
jgi:DNA-binding transcriptional MocR family regulator